MLAKRFAAWACAKMELHTELHRAIVTLRVLTKYIII